MYVTTLDVMGLTSEEYRAVLDKMGVENHPDPHIYVHLTTPIPGGFRIVEIWDSEEGFNRFLAERLAPANKALNLDRKTTITITPLHNFFGPRIQELPRLISTLPGAPHSRWPGAGKE